MNRKRNISWLRIACWIGAIAALFVAFWCVIGSIFVSILERELGLGAYSAILCVLLFSGLYVCRSEYRAVYCQQIIKPSPWLKIALGIVLIVGNFHALLFQVFNAVMCWRIYVALKQIFSSEFPLFEVKNAVFEVFASLLIFICVLCVLVAINVISIDVIRRLRIANLTNDENRPNNKMWIKVLCCVLMVYVVAVLFILFVPKNEPIDNSVYTVTEQAPQFPGGDDEYQAFIDSYAARIEYLPDSVCNPIVSYIVELNGRADSAQIVRSSGAAEIDSIALHIVDDMPLFTPAMQRGTYVRCRKFFLMRILPPNPSD